MFKKLFSSLFVVAFLILGSCFHPFYAQSEVLAHEFTEKLAEESLCSQEECINCCRTHKPNNEVVLQNIKSDEEGQGKVLTGNSGLNTRSGSLQRDLNSTTGRLKAASSRETSFYSKYLVGTVFKRE